MITITPRINQQNYPHKSARNNDAGNINFKGYTSTFTKELETVLKQGRATFEQENMLVKLLHKFMQTKMSHQKLLGEGHYGKVYKIDSKYVLKVLDKEKNYADILNGLSQKKFKNLKTYYGEPVAEFYDVFVLKNMSPKTVQVSAGVPKKFAKFYSEQECRAYYEKVYLPLFASVPQKSYNAIAKDCAELNKMNDGEYFLNFDYCNPNNFVLSGKSLRITDDIYKTSLPNPNTAAELLEVFLDKMSGFKYAPASNKESRPHSREIFKKILVAANKCKLPLGDNIAGSLLEWEVITQNICNFKSSYIDILKNLKWFQAEIPQERKRVIETEKYLNKIIKESPEN